MPLNILTEKGLTQKYLENLINIDNSTKNQIYFWVATLKDDTELVQFNIDGTENKFSIVQEQLSNNNVKSLKWISKQGSFSSYIMDIEKDDILVKDTGIYRRGKITKLSNGVFVKSWSYIFGKIIDGKEKLFIINNKGTGFYTDDVNLEVGS